MKKTAILAMAAATMLTTSVGFAAPLSDYSAGKTQVDLTWRQSDVKSTGDNANGNFDKKANINYGITTGLGNDLAIQYTNSDSKSKDTGFVNATNTPFNARATLKMQEFNLLYKLDENLSVYTGIASVKGEFNSDNGTSSSNTKNKLQFGLIGSTKLGDTTSAYAQVGFASSFTNWKIGVSQEIAPNLELNVDYSQIKSKKMAFNNGMGDVDMTAKGLGIGISYKF
jgi:hypothetical protein